MCWTQEMQKVSSKPHGWSINPFIWSSWCAEVWMRDIDLWWIDYGKIYTINFIWLLGTWTIKIFQIWEIVVGGNKNRWALFLLGEELNRLKKGQTMVWSNVDFLPTPESIGSIGQVKSLKQMISKKPSSNLTKGICLQ